MTTSVQQMRYTVLRVVAPTTIEGGGGEAKYCYRVSPGLSLYKSGQEVRPFACAGHGPLTPYLARIIKNERVTAAGHFQDVRQIELDLGPSGLTYKPGDLLGVLPQQSDEAVEQLLSLVGIEKGQWIRVEAVHGEISNGSTPAIEVRLSDTPGFSTCT